MKSILFTIIALFGAIYLSHNPPTEVVQLIDLAGQLKTHFTSNWPEWNQTEMPLLLIDEEREFAFNTSSTDATFTKDKYPTRPASFNKQFLATFPLLNNQPTIVVGTPKNTGKSSEGWTTTLLHEHFHQLQFSRPNYYSAQKALDLHKGDQTGMWMLNHPFPYEDESVNTKMKLIAKNLLSLDSVEEQKVLTKHKQLKESLRKEIGNEHYKYLNLQLWQEGYARFLEMELTNDWLNHFDEIKQDQFSRFEIQNLANEQKQQVKIHLTKSSPKDLKRVYFYALGAAEAQLIAKTNPYWKEQYFDSLFTTDHLLKMNP